MENNAMTVQYDWEDAQQSVLYHQYQGKCTWDEFFTATDDVLALVRTVPHPVIHLVDITEATFHYHKDSFTLSRKIASKIIQSGGTLIIVLNFRLAPLFNVFIKLNGQMAGHVIAVGSLAEARAQVTRLQAAIPA
jgi:hypothetical protein